MDMSMRKGYRIAFGCIGLGFLVLFALVGREDEDQTLVQFFAVMGVGLGMILSAIFWPQLVRGHRTRMERITSGTFRPHQQRPLRTFLGELVVFLLCGWLFYPASMKENTLLVLLSVVGVSIVAFLHGWWSEKQGPVTAAVSSMVLTVLLAPLLVFSEEGPHYSMIALIVLVMGIVGYGQYRMFSARTAESAAPSPEESSGEEGAIMEEEEPLDEEEG